MDKITKNMLNEYLTISNISKNLLDQRFSSAIVCGEFSELVLKYIIQNYTNDKSQKTHNFSYLFDIIFKNKINNQQVIKYIQKLPKSVRDQLMNFNYTIYRYKEIPVNKLNLIFTVHSCCVNIFYEINK